MNPFGDIVPLDVAISDDDTEVIFLGSQISESSGLHDRQRRVGNRLGLQFGMMSRHEQRSLTGTTDSFADDEDGPISVDLCDTDLSDIEVIDIEETRLDNRRFRDGSTIPNTISHMLDPRVLVPASFGPVHVHRPDMLTIFSHIHERLRAQAMLLERMPMFAVDARPRIPPSVILQGLLVRRIVSQEEANELGFCPICLEPYKPRMLVRILPKCDHLIHKTCMDKWITKSHRLTCPLDNIPIEVDHSSNLNGPPALSEPRDAARGSVSSQRDTTGSIRRSSRINSRFNLRQ